MVTAAVGGTVPIPALLRLSAAADVEVSDVAVAAVLESGGSAVSGEAKEDLNSLKERERGVSGDMKDSYCWLSSTVGIMVVRCCVSSLLSLLYAC